MAQGYEVTQNLLLQDTQSSILLERNGRASSDKQTQHINIQYFFITNRVNVKEVEIEWCPTKEMVADFMTKPLHGSHFRRLPDLMMGTTSIKKAKIPSKSTVTVTKRDGRIKVRALERRQTAVRPASLTSFALLAQQMHHRSVLGLYNILDRYSRYLRTSMYVQKYTQVEATWI
jgi:hypothetical protein